mgnify:CR=1 FL=1
MWICPVVKLAARSFVAETGKLPTLATVLAGSAPPSAAYRDAISQAKSRPVSPVYPQISQAIYKNVNAALSGQTSPQEALKKADSQINSALATF